MTPTLESQECENTSAEFDLRKRICVYLCHLPGKKISFFFIISLLNSLSRLESCLLFFFFNLSEMKQDRPCIKSTSCNVLFIIMLLLCLSLQSQEWTCVDWALMSLASPRSGSGGFFPSQTSCLTNHSTLALIQMKWWRWAVFSFTLFFFFIFLPSLPMTWHGTCSGI